MKGVYIRESVLYKRRGGPPEQKKSLEEESHLKSSNDADKKVKMLISLIK